MPKDKDKSSRSYEVGYGRPPKEHQFKPGHTGNRSGRPKRPLSPDEVLARTITEPVQVTENGRRRRVHPMELIYRQARNKAIQGDLSAAKYITDQMRIASKLGSGYDLDLLSDEDLDSLYKILSKAIII